MRITQAQPTIGIYVIVGLVMIVIVVLLCKVWFKISGGADDQ
jgi:hypothetical protein